MPTTDELRAALAVAELEEQLLQAKETDEGPSKELKEQLREARRVHRTIRDGEPTEVSALDAVVNPEPAQATAETHGGN